MNGNFHLVFSHVYRKYSCQQKLSNGFKTVGIEGKKLLTVFIRPWNF